MRFIVVFSVVSGKHAAQQKQKRMSGFNPNLLVLIHFYFSVAALAGRPKAATNSSKVLQRRRYLWRSAASNPLVRGLATCTVCVASGAL
jgi:hypothetical protein